MTWTGPIGLDDIWNNGAGSYPALNHKGVYRIQLVDSEGVGIALRRLRADDPTGTLYVGATPRGQRSTVAHRLDAFAAAVRAAHTGNRVPSRGGWNLYVFGLLDHLGVPNGEGRPTRKLVAFALTDPSWSAEDAAAAEAKVILGYRGVFGDNPPANLSSGQIGQLTHPVKRRVNAAAGRAPGSWFSV